MGGVLSWLRNLFWTQEMEIAILGLQNAGKSSFVEVINTGEFKENLMPTIGFNMHKVTKGKVTIKVWDMGGQEKFRSMWERYRHGFLLKQCNSEIIIDNEMINQKYYRKLNFTNHKIYNF